MKELTQRDFQALEELVKSILSEMRLTTGQFRFGEVNEVISQNKISVFVDGSNEAQVISCNPDSVFKKGDKVYVTLINGDPKQKFIFSRISL